jgi:AraC-like DNA-binding protein
MLFDAPTWDARFDVLDREILARVTGAAPLRREIAWTCERLTRTAGNVPIARLAGDVGWSSRHLATQFRTEFGLGPKTYGRVLRFNRAVRLMSRDDTALLADVAARAGYFDQAHFAREVHEFAGVPPRTLRDGRDDIS